MEFYYAQLNSDSICVAVSSLSAEVPEYNYNTPTTYDPISDKMIEGEPQFISRMVPIPVYSESFIGLRFNSDGKWEAVEANSGDTV